jgi:hypothetical protein
LDEKTKLNPTCFPIFLEIVPILDEKTKLSPNFPFWMESQIKPNFPIFLETLPILDEKPN